LLLIASGVTALIWLAQMYWGWIPSTLALVETGLQVLLAHALLQFGRTLVLPTLALLAMAALIPIAKMVVRLDVPWGMPAVIVYGVGLLFGFMRVLPFLLLFLRNPARIKHIIALSVFVLYELLVVAQAGMLIYVGQRFKLP